MASLTLVIANKAYSSWSLRGWLALKQTGAPFEELVIPLRESDTRSRILKYSPSARLPALIDGETTIWESLSIIEYLAERFPGAGLWPADAGARAHARSITAEMHGGFIPLRKRLPMNTRHRLPCPALDDPVQNDINRVQAVWRDARRRFGTACGEGPFLFGAFSAADAMFAPVTVRFRTYGITVEEHAASYMAAVLEHPFMAEWVEAARHEPWVISEFEGRPETAA